MTYSYLLSVKALMLVLIMLSNKSLIIGKKKNALTLKSKFIVYFKTFIFIFLLTFLL